MPGHSIELVPDGSYNVRKVQEAGIGRGFDRVSPTAQPTKKRDKRMKERLSVWTDRTEQERNDESGSSFPLFVTTSDGRFFPLSQRGFVPV